jgi:hypothetical protein
MRRANGGGGIAVLAALLAGCSAAPPRPPSAPECATPAAEPAAEPAAAEQDRDSIPPPMDTRMSYERGPSERFNWGHVTLDAEWIPAMWVTADVDSDGVSGTRGDLDTGSGIALRAGFGSTQQNIGVLYMGTWHDEAVSGRGATTQQLLLDCLYRAPIADMNGLVWFEVDAGVGVAELAFDSDQFDRQTTGSGLLHGDLEFRLGRNLCLAVGGGGFIWGNFGDTIAYGSYVTLGAKLNF